LVWIASFFAVGTPGHTSKNVKPHRSCLSNEKCQCTSGVAIRTGDCHFDAA
jgi:hypothetical protein